MDESDKFYFSEACFFIEERVVDVFEDSWTSVVGGPVPEYEMLLWGSTVREGREPNDLDVIIGYESEQISDGQRESIEGIIGSRLSPQEFAYVDPLVHPLDETEDKISESRCSRVYSVLESEWREF